MIGVDPFWWSLTLHERRFPRWLVVRRHTPPSYREQIIALARAGRTAKQLAAEFEPSEQTIRNWLFQAGVDQGDPPGPVTTAERDELARLRRENRQLKIERDMLGKAAAWFARETGTIPPGSLDS